MRLGLKALQAHKYDRAKAFFEKVLAGPSPELCDRASVHLASCNQQLSRNSASSFKSPEEQFDYAVSLMNMGDYVAARENFEALSKKSAKLDFIWYGMAVLNCLTGHFPEAISSLNGGDSFEPRQPLSGAERRGLQEPGRRSAVHRTALS